MDNKREDQENTRRTEPRLQNQNETEQLPSTARAMPPGTIPPVYQEHGPIRTQGGTITPMVDTQSGTVAFGDKVFSVNHILTGTHMPEEGPALQAARAWNTRLEYEEDQRRRAAGTANKELQIPKSWCATDTHPVIPVIGTSRPKDEMQKDIEIKHIKLMATLYLQKQMQASGHDTTATKRLIQMQSKELQEALDKQTTYKANVTL